MTKEGTRTDYKVEVTEDYEGLIPFFVENELEFDTEEIPVVTDIVKCWKITDGGKLIGGFVLAKRQGEFICDGVAVDQEYRKHDLGKALLDTGLAEVKKLGGERMFLVARAPGFFRKAGFVTVPRDEAPNFFECLTCPQYGVSCHPEVMRLDLTGKE
jgi:N-acetylglutamate synthase-like GNAT family acetyltransferase